MEAHEALSDKDDISTEVSDIYMKIRNCPSCGLVAMYTSTCGYCGSKCD